MPEAAIETRIISADDHLDLATLPPTLWTDRVSGRLRDEAPRVIETADGRFWSAEGRILGPSGWREKGHVERGLGLRPGQPDTRLEDMDRDGVWCQVIYGPPQGLPLQDPDLLQACLRVYNDWTAEFNATAPDRLVALPFISARSPSAARDELRRVAGLGHRGALLHAWEASEPVIDSVWEPFWAEAAESGLPIHFHLGGGHHTLLRRLDGWYRPARISVAPMQLDELLTGMIFSGIFERHPGVTLVLGESGLGWIPYVLERMDHEYHKYYDMTTDVRLANLPSELFHRNVVATYEIDEVGLELISRIGEDNVMWASDYPHGDSTWPHSRQAIAESPLSKLDLAVQRKVLWETAARVYGIA